MIGWQVGRFMCIRCSSYVIFNSSWSNHFLVSGNLRVLAVKSQTMYQQPNQSYSHPVLWTFPKHVAKSHTSNIWIVPLALLRRRKLGWSYIIQLMHSFEVNIRICQPENSDVHRGEAEVNITFEGWLILMLTEKECTNCFVIWHCLSFPSFI